MLIVTCPYCNNAAELTSSTEVYGKNYGMIWLCRPCNALVGTHKHSVEHLPLGTLGNSEVRAWRKKAHDVFDRLWKDTRNPSVMQRMTRANAYIMLQHIMGLPSEQAHIGKFDINKCKRLIQRLCRFSELIC